MRLQNPLKQNPVRPDVQFQQVETAFNRYSVINRLFLISDPENMQETQEKH